MGLLKWLSEEKRTSLVRIDPLISELELITQIHNEFDNAQDALLVEAKNVLARYDADLLARTQDVTSRLKKLGFTSTPTVKKQDAIDAELLQRKKEAELITYYKATYPFLKFLTEKELNRICGKYGLIFAPVGNYINEVPEKNLREIENCQKIKIEDAINRAELEEDERYAKASVSELLERTYQRLNMNMRFAMTNNYKSSFNSFETSNEKTGLFIAAPKSHFNHKDMEQKSEFGYGKIEVKDPIVFRYVRGGIQVLTKWGLEANDPSLVVEKLN